MDNPAIVDDLTNAGLKVGDGVGAVPAEVAEHRLNQAWRALQREPTTRGIEAWVQGGLVSTEDVADVVAAAALRVLRNPEGFVKESSSLDDYSESNDRADATEDLYFTAAELRRLQPVLDVPTAGSMKYR